MSKTLMMTFKINAFNDISWLIYPNTDLNNWILAIVVSILSQSLTSPYNTYKLAVRIFYWYCSAVKAFYDWKSFAFERFSQEVQCLKNKFLTH
jgi:hypothetical protein